MGFHICEYCKAIGVVPETSSGDVTMTFDSGASFVMPDMILHYMLEHGYLPPIGFALNLLQNRLVDIVRQQTKGAPVPVGYLNYPEDPRPDWKLDDYRHWAISRETELDLLKALSRFLRYASHKGDRVQTRGG